MTELPRPYTVRMVGRGILGLPLYGVEYNGTIVHAGYNKNTVQEWADAANLGYAHCWLEKY